MQICPDRRTVEHCDCSLILDLGSTSADYSSEIRIRGNRSRNTAGLLRKGALDTEEHKAKRDKANPIAATFFFINTSPWHLGRQAGLGRI
jgi:hypothetical protein